MDKYTTSFITTTFFLGGLCITGLGFDMNSWTVTLPGLGLVIAGITRFICSVAKYLNEEM